MPFYLTRFSYTPETWRGSSRIRRTVERQLKVLAVQRIELHPDRIYKDAFEIISSSKRRARMKRKPKCIP